MKILERVGILLLWVLGFVLPVFAFGFELTTHKFSGGLYDIMPTPWHALLWLCMPLSFLLAELWVSQRPNGVRWLANFLHGVSLPVIVLHLIAVGSTVLQALILFAFVCIDFVVSLLTGTHGLDLIDSYAGTSLVALTPLAVLVYWSLSSWNMMHFVQARAFPWVMGIVCSMFVLAVLEMSAVGIRDRIVGAIREMENGEQPKNLEALESARCQAVIERLIFSGRQGSSAAPLYAVGPVDVFGPISFVLDGRRVPTYASSNLTMKRDLMLRLFQLMNPGDPSAKPVPWSWRGLSPGEKAQLGRE